MSSTLLICFYTDKCFHVLLCIINNPNKRELNEQTVLFQAIQFSINHLFAHSLNVKLFYFTHRLDSVRSEWTWEQWQGSGTPQHFGRYGLQPSSGVCQTREPSRNFELRPLLKPRGSPVLIPLAITGYKCWVFLYCYLPVVRIEPATSRWLSP